MKKMQRAICIIASLALIALFDVQQSDAAGTNSALNELFQAISSNNVDRVKSILEVNPALADATDDLNDPPLVMAASRTNLELINVLLDAGAEVDKVGLSHVTALGKVLELMLSNNRNDRFDWRFRLPENQTTNGRAARLLIAKVLLEHGASIFSKIRNQGSLISGSPDGEIADFLLVNQRAKNERDADGNSVVHIAAFWARTNALVTLAKQKVDLDATNFAGLTALQAVSQLPDYEEIEISNDEWDSRLNADGQRYRQLTASLLLSLGAKCDIFTAIKLNWTNVVADLLTTNPEIARLKNGSGQMPLHMAAQFGETNIALLLLQAGSPIESTNRQGQRPLDVAAANGQNNMAELLVAHGATVNCDNGIKSPLHWAAEQGNTPLLTFLLNADAWPNAEDEHNQSPLDLAAKNNHEPEVKLLLAAHARFPAGTNNVTTPFHWAVKNGNTNLMALLLLHGADINSRNEDGKTAVLLAHERDNFSALEYLLAHGANINDRDDKGNTALHLRASADADLISPPVDPFRPKTDKTSPARSMMEFLLEHGADVNATNYAGETPLHRVAEKSFSTNDSIQAVQSWIQPLMDHHANIEARDTNGCTVFHLAAQKFKLPLAEVLLEHGADINERDKSGATAFQLALKSKIPLYFTGFNSTVINTEADDQMVFLEWFLKHGAGVNMADKSGTTPLLLVMSEDTRSGFNDNNSKEKIIALLLRYGARINAVDLEGRTPLHFACNRELAPWPESRFYGIPSFLLPGDGTPFYMFWTVWKKEVDQLIPEMLLTNGALVNVQDKKGNTPLHYAAEAVRSNTIVLLLQNGASRTIRNRDGKTPLELAYENGGGFQIISLLQSSGLSGEIGDAVRRNDLEMVKAFLKDDPHNVNASWLWGSNPLHWACNQGNLEMVKLLLAHGADVNPVHHPLNNRDHRVEFNRIMNFYQTISNSWNGDNVSTASNDANGDKNGDENLRLSVYLSETPLQLALANNHYEIAKLLIKHGAKVDLVSAASLGMIGVIQRAVRIEPQLINKYSTRGSWYFKTEKNDFDCSVYHSVQSGTLLHFAVLGNQPKTVKYLLEAGADAAMLDDEGRTPYQLAVEMNLSDTAEMLKNHRH